MCGGCKAVAHFREGLYNRAMNDSEIIITVSRLAEIIGVSRRTIYNQLGRDITYIRVMDYLDICIDNAQEDAAKYAEAQRHIYQIHKSVREIAS